MNNLIQYQTQTVGYANTDLFCSEEDQRSATPQATAVCSPFCCSQEARGRNLRGFKRYDD